MRKGTFLGISSIFALSMIMLFASNALAGDAPAIDKGNNAWMLTSSALVLIMIIMGINLAVKYHYMNKKNGFFGQLIKQRRNAIK